MDSHFKPSVSIEKFAAYLDGNLPESEMRRVASLIENDDALKSILDVSEQVDASLEDYSSDGMQIPEDIVNLNFELPCINDPSAPLDMVPIDGALMLDDVVACTEEPFVIDSDSNDHLYANDSSIDNQNYSDDCNMDDCSELDNTQITLDD